MSRGGDDYAELAQGRPIFHWFMLARARGLLRGKRVSIFHPEETGMNTHRRNHLRPDPAGAGHRRAWRVVAVACTVRIYWRVGSTDRAVAQYVARCSSGSRASRCVVAVAAAAVAPRISPAAHYAIASRSSASDSSLSMKQRDAGSETRLDAAERFAGGLRRRRRRTECAADPRLRLFEFSDDARPVQKSVLDLVPAGKTTRFHKSVGTMLNTPGRTTRRSTR